jgi:hypothetical protein
MRQNHAMGAHSSSSAEKEIIINKPMRLAIWSPPKRIEGNLEDLSVVI